MIYVLSKGSDQPVATARDASGLATEFGTKIIWAPAIYKYTVGPYVVKEWRGTIVWTLTLVSINALIAPEANSDNDVKIISPGKLDKVMTNQQITAARNWIANSDIQATITNGMTVKQVIVAILNGLGQSTDAEAQLDALEAQLDAAQP